MFSLLLHASHRKVAYFCINIANLPQTIYITVVGFNTFPFFHNRLCGPCKAQHLSSLCSMLRAQNKS